MTTIEIPETGSVHQATVEIERDDVGIIVGVVLMRYGSRIFSQCTATPTQARAIAAALIAEAHAAEASQ